MICYRATSIHVSSLEADIEKHPGSVSEVVLGLHLKLGLPELSLQLRKQKTLRDNLILPFH